MSRRRTAQEVAHRLREADRDLAKGLTVPDICRKVELCKQPIIAGVSNTPPTRSMASGEVANRNSRLTVSEVVAELLLTTKCSRTSPKKTTTEDEARITHLHTRNRPCSIALRGCHSGHVITIFLTAVFLVVEKKVVWCDEQLAAADYLERPLQGLTAADLPPKYCSVVLVPRYRPSRRPNELPLTREIKRWARRHPRYGYRRIHALLICGGWTVNIKRVRRLWNSLGLHARKGAAKWSIWTDCLRLG